MLPPIEKGHTLHYETIKPPVEEVNHILRPSKTLPFKHTHTHHDKYNVIVSAAIWAHSIFAQTGNQGVGD